MRAAEQIKREYIFIPDEFDPRATRKCWTTRAAPGLPARLCAEERGGSTGELVRMVDLAIKEASSLLGPRSQVFMTGGGLAMMRGGREYLADKLSRPVKIPMAKAAKLNSPAYASALGLVDLVFDSIEQRTAQEESLPGRLAGGLRGLLNRKG
jgi:cell division ATPase FtsA